MRIKLQLIVLLSVFTLGAFAQDGGMTGRVVSRLGRAPIAGVKVTTSPLAGSSYTNAEGQFTLDGIDTQEYMVELSAPGYESLSIVVRVEGGIKDLYTIVLVPEVENIELDDSFFAEYESDLSSDGTAAPVSLSASKDVFSSIASYKFGEVRFSQRGYGSKYADVMLNGINMVDALSGYSPWSLWGGLNEATRNQEATIGLEVSDQGLGGLNGSTNILARASHLRRGWTTSVVNGNSMYRYRLMATYASGMQDNGWAYAFSISTRQGSNDYVDGVYYNTFSYFASIERQIDDKNLISFTFLGAPTERGAQQASTQEAYDLLDNNYYNPNVGIQDGEMRNTRVREFHEPIAMLNYNHKYSEATEFNVAASYRFGQNGYSALTWCAGSDPRPDYYRYLPSYYNCPNPGVVAEEWKQNTNNISYIDLDALYQINYNGVEDLETYGEGTRAYYMIEERHTDQRDANLAGQISHKFKNGSTLHAGVTGRYNRTEYYSTVKDLLGGDYWVDVDKFAERDFGSNAEAYQNNLQYYYDNGTAPVVREGDKYSYDYYANVLNAAVWGTYKHVFGFAPITASISAELGYSSLWREGMWQKGLFPDNSLGNSEKVEDITYKAKFNAAYNINRIFSLTANAAYMNEAPTFQSAFISPRTRNSITPGLDTEKIMAFDAAFNARVGDAKFRVAGFYTTIEDQTRVISFYNDLQSSFDNFAMSGIDTRYMGVEAAFSVPLIAGISLNSALSLGEYIYNSNPYYVEMADNDAAELSSGTVWWEGYKVEGTPQTAVNLGLGYRSPSYLFLSLDLNYYDNNYLSMNPLYRTDNALTTTMLKDQELIDAMRAQERFDSAYTLSASVGKSWYINRIYNLGVNLSVNNILNNQNIKTGGYEQMRLSEDTDLDIYERFDSKYFYMLGRTYYLNVYFRF
ncbi:MAG: carboxypeptidase regulatory-like domain-containing protein [Rikenellaceae bacterium]